MIKKVCFALFLRLLLTLGASAALAGEQVEACMLSTPAG